jgi:hypothetical protein
MRHLSLATCEDVFHTAAQTVSGVSIWLLRWWAANGGRGRRLAIGISHCFRSHPAHHHAGRTGICSDRSGRHLLAVVAILVFSVAYAWAAQRYAMAGAMLLRRGLRGILCQPVDAAPAAASAAFVAPSSRAPLVQLGMKRMLSMSKTLAASKV